MLKRITSLWDVAQREAPSEDKKILEQNPAMEKIKHPSRTLVMGKSQSGKTTLAVKIAKHLLPSIDMLFICSATYGLQPTWKDLDKSVTHAFSSLDTCLEKLFEVMNYEDHKKRILLIIDDVSHEKKLNEGSKGTLSSIAYNAVWYNMSVICVCHKLSNISPAFRENVEHLIIFQMIDCDELDKIAKSFSITGNKKDFIYIYTSIVAKDYLSGNAHTFLYVCYKDGVSVYKNFTHLINL